MKTRQLLSIVLASAVVVGSSQAIAGGLTYDPYEIYYSKYYGIGTESVAVADEVKSQVPSEITSEIKSKETLDDSAFHHPSDDYYNTYYEMIDLPEKSKQSESVVVEDDADMADPTNYFKW